MLQTTGLSERLVEKPHDQAETDRQEVLDQLERILSHHVFKSSKRCVNLLSYLVSHALDEEGAAIKERTLGIEVFGRDLDYETSSDPVVRTTANEIRKRLAQYYQEVGNRDKVEIELFPGAYLPRFTFRKSVENPPIAAEKLIHEVRTAAEPAAPPVLNDSTPGTAAVSLSPQPLTSRWKRKPYVVAAIASVIVVAGLVVGLGLRGLPSSNLDRFWRPVLDSSDPVLICVGIGDVAGMTPAQMTEARNNLESQIDGKMEQASPPVSAYGFPALQLADAAALSQISGFLSKHDKKFTMRTVGSISFADLRSGPVILVGMLDNSWTLKLTSGLRFRPRVDAANQTMWIEDSQHPQRRDWQTPMSGEYSASLDDYALVSRVQDASTGNITIEIGGLGLHGTQAAGEFVTASKYVGMVPRGLSDLDKNVQVVLKTRVVHGDNGPPEVVAVYYW